MHAVDRANQLRMSPSHFGRQLLGLALTAPDALPEAPSEGSKLHGLFDEDSLLGVADTYTCKAPSSFS